MFSNFIISPLFAHSHTLFSIYLKRYKDKSLNLLPSPLWFLHRYYRFYSYRTKEKFAKNRSFAILVTIPHPKIKTIIPQIIRWRVYRLKLQNRAKHILSRRFTTWTLCVCLKLRNKMKIIAV